MPSGSSGTFAALRPVVLTAIEIGQTMEPEEAPEFLTSGEVAAMFRVARSTVTTWAAKGLLPYTRTPSGRLRFYREPVERLLNDGRNAPQ